jgi:hypothetical protein
MPARGVSSYQLVDNFFIVFILDATKKGLYNYHISTKTSSFSFSLFEINTGK